MCVPSPHKIFRNKKAMPFEKDMFLPIENKTLSLVVWACRKSCKSKSTQNINTIIHRSTYMEHMATCQSIEINKNKHVYHQSQVRMPNGCGVEWAECSLIIGTGCRVQVFKLILDSSVGLSAGIQSSGDLVSETLMGSNPAFRRGKQLVSVRFEYRLPVPEHHNLQQQICISPEPGAKASRQWGRVGWMLADHRDGLSSSSSSLDPRQLSRFVSRHSVCWRIGVRDLGFESCIQQKKTTCLLSIRTLLACAKASKLTTMNICI